MKGITYSENSAILMPIFTQKEGFICNDQTACKHGSYHFRPLISDGHISLTHFILSDKTLKTS